MSTQTCPSCKLTFDGAVVRKDGNVNCPACGLVFKATLPPEPLWYYAQDKQKRGPVSLAGLQKLANSGLLRVDDMVLQVGANTWQPARELSGISFPSSAGVGVSNLTANGPVSSIPVASLCPPGVEQACHENRNWLKQVSATVRSVTAYLHGRSRSTKIMLGAGSLAGLLTTCVFGSMCCMPGFLQLWSKSNSPAQVDGASDLTVRKNGANPMDGVPTNKSVPPDTKLNPANVADAIVMKLLSVDSTKYAEVGYAGFTFGESFDVVKPRLTKVTDRREEAWLVTEDEVQLEMDPKNWTVE